MSDTRELLDPLALIPGAPPADDALPGMTLGDYVVEKAVAWGGMGIVYRAVHPLIGRKVAVKVLRPSFAADPEQAARFLKEAQAISAIKHRGIIDIISFGKLPDGRQYMVMEYLEGETLEEAMKREGAMSPARALALIEEVLEALSAAHQVGVVHRDLKPSNVYITNQSNGSRYVKLVDFGLARRASLDDLNRVGGKASLMAGTPEYLSPEQVGGLAATPRTDLYCLGVMLFEMVAGRLPFKGESVLELLHAHQTLPAPRASSFVGALPSMLDDLIDSCLQKSPELRPSSADVARQTVQRILRQLKEDTTRVASVPARSNPAPPAPAGEPSAPQLAAKKDTDRVPEVREARANPSWLRRGWPAVVGVVLLSGGTFLLANRQSGDEVVAQPVPPPPRIEEPPPPVLPRVEEALPVLPPPPPPPRPPRPGPKKDRPAPRKERESARVTAPKPDQIPVACEGDQTAWKRQLSIAFDGADQAYLGKMAGKTDLLADKELSALRGKIKLAGDRAACIQVINGLKAWQRKYSPSSR